MILTNKPSSNYTPAPEGYHNAVCVDVIDLGIVVTPYGDKPQLKLVFELGGRDADGNPITIGQKFTASLHEKAKLAIFLGKWRGKPVAEGEMIDLRKLIGVSASLMVAQRESEITRKKYSYIDTVARPKSSLVASGKYDGVAERARLADIAAKFGQPTAAAKPVRDTHADIMATFPEDDVMF